MATETESEPLDRRAAHVRSLVVTTIACLGGLAAGVASAAVTSGATDRLGVVVLAGVAVVELGLMRLFGVDVDDFSAKDYLYVLFMTVALWFISWGILLTSGAV